MPSNVGIDKHRGVAWTVCALGQGGVQAVLPTPAVRKVREGVVCPAVTYHSQQSEHALCARRCGQLSPSGVSFNPPRNPTRQVLSPPFCREGN